MPSASALLSKGGFSQQPRCSTTRGKLLEPLEPGTDFGHVHPQKSGVWAKL
jgi:hypothetical protein